MSVFYGNEFEFYSVREHREPSLVLCDNLERWDGSREGRARGRVCVCITYVYVYVCVCVYIYTHTTL